MLIGIFGAIFGIWLIRRGLAAQRKASATVVGETVDWQAISAAQAAASAASDEAQFWKKKYEDLAVASMSELNSVLGKATLAAENRLLETHILQDSLAREARYKAVLHQLLATIHIPESQASKLLEAIESPESELR